MVESSKHFWQGSRLPSQLSMLTIFSYLDYRHRVLELTNALSTSSQKWGLAVVAVTPAFVDFEKRENKGFRKQDHFVQFFDYLPKGNLEHIKFLELGGCLTAD